MKVLAQLVLPLAERVRGDLRALVHALGMQAIATMLERERTELCGERHAHAKARKATRGGSTPGRLTLGGRTVQVRRPRVVGRDGDEVALETWEQRSAADPMSGRAYERRVVGVATRKYARSLLRATGPAMCTASARSRSRVRASTRRRP